MLQGVSTEIKGSEQEHPMGFWSGTGKVMGQIVDVRVDKWVGVDTIKANTNNLIRWTKSIFRVEEATREETFEAAMIRLPFNRCDD